MKRQQNFLPRLLLLIAAMVLPLLVSAGDTLSVTSLTLGDDHLSLSGKVIVKGDSILGYYDNGVPLVLPDTITVDSIAIAYAGSKTDALKIKEGDNDSLSAQVTKSLSSKEIKKAHGGKELVLVSGKRYTITHGNKTWTLQYAATPSPAEEDQGDEGTTDDSSGNKGFKWWYIVIVIAIAVLLFLIVFWIVRKRPWCAKKVSEGHHVGKRDESKKGGDKKGGDPRKGGDTVTGDDGGPTPSQKSKEDEILEKLQNLEKLDIISASISEIRGKIDLLHPQGQQKRDVGSQPPKKVPLEEQLRDPSNNKELTDWILRMIRSGYAGQLSNDASSPEALCRGIAKKLCDAEKNVEEKMQDKMADTLHESLLGSDVDSTLEKIKAAEEERKALVGEKETLTREKDGLQSKYDELLKKTTEMVERLHTAAGKLKTTRQPLLSARNANDVEQFTNSEKEFYDALQTFADALCSFSVAEGTSPAAARNQIQEQLVAAMGDKNGAVSKLCRYYAYSQLPFMRDSSRDDGVTLHAKNVATLYTALCNIFTPFGITFDIPALFTLSLADRDYQCVTETSDLKWLCPDMTKRIPAKLNSNRDLIIDIDTVGYSVDGEQRVQTAVLTTL